jgi:hypothetical protein
MPNRRPGRRAGARVLAAVCAGMVVGACAGRAEVQFPMSVYGDGNPWEQHGAPSGWMGDFRDLRMDQKWTNHVHGGAACIKIIYTAQGSRYANMVGVMWQHPANNDGTIDGGLDLRGAKKVTFWARGEQGGEMIETFFFGGALGAYPDTDKTGINNIYLSKEWTQYEIDLSGLDLSYISCFFGWATARFNNPDGMVFYLDDIQVE